MGYKKVKRFKLECIICRKIFLRPEWQYKRNLAIKTKNFYCSKFCYDKWQRETHGPNWKGGKNLLNGYVRKWVSKTYKKRGWEFEHRLVMEKHLGKRLTKRQFVHHKNGIKTDNRIENLELMTLNSHRGKIECPHCKKIFYIR